MKAKALKPVLAETKRPREGVLIQIQEKKRGANGRLTFRKSRSITVYNVTLDRAHRRILNAFRH